MEIRLIQSYFADMMEGEEKKAIVRMKTIADHNPEINGSEKHENSKTLIREEKGAKKMNRKQEEAVKVEISPEFMDQINPYLKDVNHSLTCPKAEKEFYIDKVRNGILVFIDENPDATIEDILQEIGDPKTVANDLLETATSETPEKIRKQMTFRRIILIAAIIIIAIVGIVYASALLDAHFSINGTEHESVDYIDTWSNIS
uniref:hypothetical protein n=1 Tax=Candidatus Fimivicinus sp. TaxID=3056640 RepID=UPI003FED8236